MPIILAASLLATFCVHTTSANDVTFRTVAQTGDLIPNTGSETQQFGQISSPAINAHGQTAFIATTLSDYFFGKSIYSEDSGQITRVVKGGQAAPDGPDHLIIDMISSYYYIRPVISDNGDVIFGTQLYATDDLASNSIAFYRHHDGVTHEMIRKNAPLRNSNPQDMITWFDSEQKSLLINSSGQSPIAGFRESSITADGDQYVLYFQTPGAAVSVLHENDPAPGSTTNAVFNSFSVNSINSSGQIGMYAHTYDPASDQYIRGLYAGTPGSLTPVAIEGQIPPDATDSVGFDLFSGLQLNDNGQYLFSSTRATNTGADAGNALYSNASGTLREIARDGQPVPNQSGNEFFLGLTSPLLNATGNVAFLGHIVDTNDDHLYAAIFKSTDEGLQELVRSGQQVPGLSDGITISEFGQIPYPHNVLTMNAAGQIAFLATLEGPGVTNLTDDNAIIVIDPDGTLRTIVREGDMFDINHDPLVEDLHEIFSIELLTGSTDQGGGATSFNSSGELAFVLGLSGVGYALIVADTLPTIPEPATLMIVGLTSLLISQRHTRHKRGSSRLM